jgi:hypothetical protein
VVFIEVAEDREGVFWGEGAEGGEGADEGAERFIVGVGRIV